MERPIMLDEEMLTKVVHNYNEFIMKCQDEGISSELLLELMNFVLTRRDRTLRFKLHDWQVL